MKWVSVLLLCIGLSACIPQMDMPKAREQILFRDDFSDSRNRADWIKGGGDWTWRENGSLECHRNQGWASLWLRQPMPSHYRLEFDVFITPDSHGGFSVLLNGLGKGNAFDTCYHIGFGAKENTTTILQRGGITIQEEKSALLEFSKWYHVAVTFSDGLIVAFLDGQEVFVFQDRSPLYGPNNQYLGIGGDWAADTTLIFDNVAVF